MVSILLRSMSVVALWVGLAGASDAPSLRGSPAGQAVGTVGTTGITGPADVPMAAPSLTACTCAPSLESKCFCSSSGTGPHDNATLELLQRRTEAIAALWQSLKQERFNCDCADSAATCACHFSGPNSSPNLEPGQEALQTSLQERVAQWWAASQSAKASASGSGSASASASGSASASASGSGSGRPAEPAVPPQAGAEAQTQTQTQTQTEPHTRAQIETKTGAEATALVAARDGMPSVPAGYENSFWGGCGCSSVGCYCGHLGGVGGATASR